MDACPWHAATGPPTGGPLLKAVRRRCCRPRRGCCGPSPGGVDFTRAATTGVPRWRAGGRTADRDHRRQRSAVAGGAPGPASGDRVPGSCLVGGRPGCCRGGPGAGGVRRCCGPAVGGSAATGRDHGGHGVRAGRPASHGGSRAAGPASGAVVMVTPAHGRRRAARRAGHSPIGEVRRGEDSASDDRSWDREHPYRGFTCGENGNRPATRRPVRWL